MRTSSQDDLQVSIYWAKYWCGNIYSLPVIGVFSLRVSHFERKTLMSRSEKMWSHQCFVNQWIRVQVQARSTSCLCVWRMGLTRLWAKYLVRQDALVDIWRFKIGLTRLWAMSPVRHDALMDLWILIKISVSDFFGDFDACVGVVRSPPIHLCSAHISCTHLA